MPNVYLVGFMGAGKTSAGRHIAGRLRRPFVDIDAELEEHFGCPVADVFARRGETEFRAAESRLLRDVVTRDACVVSTGGGAFCSAGNRELMRRRGGVSVFLDVPIETALERIQDALWQRPKLGEDVASARRLWEARRPLYELADHVVEVDRDWTVEQVADEVISRVGDLCAERVECPETPCAT